MSCKVMNQVVCNDWMRDENVEGLCFVNLSVMQSKKNLGHSLPHAQIAFVVLILFLFLANNSSRLVLEANIFNVR